MEKIVVEIDNSLWKIISYDVGLKVNVDYVIKEVKIEDDFFKEDATHKELRSQANKAYKKLKEYEFLKRSK